MLIPPAELRCLLGKGRQTVVDATFSDDMMVSVRGCALDRLGMRCDGIDVPSKYYKLYAGTLWIVFADMIIALQPAIRGTLVVVFDVRQPDMSPHVLQDVNAFLAKKARGYPTTW